MPLSPCQKNTGGLGCPGNKDKDFITAMDVIAGPILKLLLTVIDIYVWIVVIGVILSWLTAYNVVNTSNRFVYMVGDFIHRITEPVLGRIRKVLPAMGGFDLSPVALILGLILLQDLLINVIVKFGS